MIRRSARGKPASPLAASVDDAEVNRIARGRPRSRKAWSTARSSAAPPADTHCCPV